MFWAFKLFREVCVYGFYIHDDSTLAKVDGAEHPIEVRNGHQYVEFIELILNGSYWNNHTVWWDTLEGLITVGVTPSDQVGNPKETFETGTLAYFRVALNNTYVRSKLALLMTVNVYDSENTTIGVASFQGPIMPGISIIIIGVPIPATAHLGSATVYANAYTDWPHKGGIPYCPEASATFQIIEP